MARQIYHLGNIRELLLNGFDDRDLRRLCYDVPDFRPVYDQLARGTGKADIVDELIEYAEKNLLLDTLLALAQALNPARYETHGPYYRTDPEPRLQKWLPDATQHMEKPAEQVGFFDFVLDVGEGTGREYPVAALHTPAGEARETMYFPYDELALQSCLKDLQIALLSSGGQRRRVLSKQEQTVQEFGCRLFDALFVGEVRNRYDISRHEASLHRKGVRLRLRIRSPRLAALPWEYLYDPREDEFLCLSSDISVLRYIELPQPMQLMTVQPPLRILGVITNPSDLPQLDVECEKQWMEEATAELQKQGLIELVWLEGQTWRDLRQKIRSGMWHVFHFIGHGGLNRVSSEGYIALSDEMGHTYHCTATQLSRLLSMRPPLRLVLLNACESARAGEQDIFSSTASLLVRKGIPTVVAMQYEITDRASLEFTRTFYETLADGMPVDQAVTEARIAISAAVPNTLEWGIPVLHTRLPDLRLFDESVGDTKLTRAARAIRRGDQALADDDFEEACRQYALAIQLEEKPETAKKLELVERIELVLNQAQESLAADSERTETSTDTVLALLETLDELQRKLPDSKAIGEILDQAWRIFINRLWEEGKRLLLDKSLESNLESYRGWLRMFHEARRVDEKRSVKLAEDLTRRQPNLQQLEKATSALLEAVAALSEQDPKALLEATRLLAGIWQELDGSSGIDHLAQDPLYSEVMQPYWTLYYSSLKLFVEHDPYAGYNWLRELKRIPVFGLMARTYRPTSIHRQKWAIEAYRRGEEAAQDDQYETAIDYFRFAIEAPEAKQIPLDMPELPLHFRDRLRSSKSSAELAQDIRDRLNRARGVLDQFADKPQTKIEMAIRQLEENRPEQYDARIGELVTVSRDLDVLRQEMPTGRAIQSACEQALQVLRAVGNQKLAESRHEQPLAQRRVQAQQSVNLLQAAVALDPGTRSVTSRELAKAEEQFHALQALKDSADVSKEGLEESPDDLGEPEEHSGDSDAGSDNAENGADDLQDGSALEKLILLLKKPIFFIRERLLQALIALLLFSFLCFAGQYVVSRLLDQTPTPIPTQGMIAIVSSTPTRTATATPGHTARPTASNTIASTPSSTPTRSGGPTITPEVTPKSTLTPTSLSVTPTRAPAHTSPPPSATSAVTPSPTYTAAPSSVGRIAFQSNRDGNSEIYIMNPDGTEQTNVANHSALDYDAIWSPNGARIAFASDRDGNSEIYVVNVNGTGLQRLTYNEAIDNGPWWSSDGMRISFESNRDGNREIYIMNSDGSGQTNLTMNSAWDQMHSQSPDGRLIAFERVSAECNQTHVMNSDGSEQRCLALVPARLTLVSWSPDSRRVAFTSSLDYWKGELYVAKLDGSDRIRLTDNGEGETEVTWSPDGSHLAFVIRVPNGGDDIYVVSADGTSLRNLTDSPSNEARPSWSPDSKRIVYASDRDGNWEIYVMNADGNGVTRLTNNPAKDSDPLWSAK